MGIMDEALLSKEETAKALKHIPLGLMDIEDAEKRLMASCITLESFSGPVYAKLDNCLPISGSVTVAYTRYCGLLSRWLYRRAL